MIVQQRVRATGKTHAPYVSRIIAAPLRLQSDIPSTDTSRGDQTQRTCRDLPVHEPKQCLDYLLALSTIQVSSDEILAFIGIL